VTICGDCGRRASGHAVQMGEVLGYGFVYSHGGVASSLGAKLPRVTPGVWLQVWGLNGGKSVGRVMVRGGRSISVSVSAVDIFAGHRRGVHSCDGAEVPEHDRGKDAIRRARQSQREWVSGVM